MEWAVWVTTLVLGSLKAHQNVLDLPISFMLLLYAVFWSTDEGFSLYLNQGSAKVETE
jgi:hypothetical protein